MVPSGTKLMVMSSGCGQTLPETEYGTTRDSRTSTKRRARGVGEGRGGTLFDLKKSAMEAFLHGPEIVRPRWRRGGASGHRGEPPPGWWLPRLLRLGLSPNLLFPRPGRWAKFS